MKIETLKNFASMDQSFKEWLTTCPKEYIWQINEVTKVREHLLLGGRLMNASLEQNVETLSNHYVERFKFLLEGEMLNLQVKDNKDANSN